MNTQHLELAVKVAETGSLSKAAAALFLSQPNASSIIKALEEDLGIHIFRRTSFGMVLTEEGKIFVAHAQAILQHVDFLKKMKENSSRICLRLGVTTYTPLVIAFRQMYVDCAKCDNLELFCKTMTYEEAVDALYYLELDLYAALLPEQLNVEQVKLMQKRQLTVKTLRNVQITVNLRSGHPLASTGRLDLEKLADYPYIDYVSASMVDLANRYMEGKIGYRNRIAVDDKTLRRELVAASDAFSVSCQLPNSLTQREGLVSYPLPGNELQVCLIMRQKDCDKPEIKKYEQYLRDALEEL